jgi:drug/metabolite transporter (DMT)-like permease
MKEPDMSTSRPTRHSAGAFDILNVIAALFGFYGIVLIVMGIVADTPADRVRTGDVNANLWAGIGMAVVAVIFVAWTRLRPMIVERGQKSGGDS